jgi:release factor glutamine methyltransferase
VTGERGQTVAEALAWARGVLTGSPTPALDARVLLEKASGLDRAALIASDREPLGSAVAAQFADLVARRGEGAPVAYLVGQQDFYGRPFRVGPGALIPRPETEMLIDAALSGEASAVLDMGTGSGCLLVTYLAECGDAEGIGIDLSEEALGYARDNAESHGVADRSTFRLMSFAEAPSALEGPFDLILANPPYISAGTALPVSVAQYEPASALYSGSDGLDAHREVAEAIAQLLDEEGRAFIEIGHDQGETAAAVYQTALEGRSVQTKKDAAGLARMVAVGPKARL